MLQERALPLAPADAPGEQFEVAQLLQALADAQGEQARLQLLLREAEDARQALEEGQEQLRDFEDLLACVGAQETKVGGPSAPAASAARVHVRQRARISCATEKVCWPAWRAHLLSVQGGCPQQASWQQAWQLQFSSRRVMVGCSRG